MMLMMMFQTKKMLFAHLWQSGEAGEPHLSRVSPPNHKQTPQVPVQDFAGASPEFWSIQWKFPRNDTFKQKMKIVVSELACFKMSSSETELLQDAQLHVEIELDVEVEVSSKSVGWSESWRSGAPTRGGWRRVWQPGCGQRGQEAKVPNSLPSLHLGQEQHFHLGQILLTSNL